MPSPKTGMGSELKLARKRLFAKISEAARSTNNQTSFMGRIYNNIIETVGRTPLVKLNKVTAGVPARPFCSSANFSIRWAASRTASAWR